MGKRDFGRFVFEISFGSILILASHLKGCRTVCCYYECITNTSKMVRATQFFCLVYLMVKAWFYGIIVYL